MVSVAVARNRACLSARALKTAAPALSGDVQHAGRSSATSSDPKETEDGILRFRNGTGGVEELLTWIGTHAPPSPYEFVARLSPTDRLGYPQLPCARGRLQRDGRELV